MSDILKKKYSQCQQIHIIINTKHASIKPGAYRGQQEQQTCASKQCTYRRRSEDKVVETYTSNVAAE